MSRRLAFRWVFLGLTFVVLGLEFLAGLDPNPNTEAWTEHIVRVLPDEVTYGAIAGIAGWALYHFYKHYQRKRQTEGSGQE